GLRCTFAEPGVGGVGGEPDHEVVLRALVGPGGGEDEGGPVMNRPFGPDTDAEAGEAVAAEAIDDRAESVMSAVAPFLANPEASDLQIEIVTYDQQVVQGERAIAHEVANRLAREVHEGDRFDEQDRFAAHMDL